MPVTRLSTRFTENSYLGQQSAPLIKQVITCLAIEAGACHGGDSQPAVSAVRPLPAQAAPETAFIKYPLATSG